MLAAEATSFLEFQVSSVLIPKMYDINLSPKLVVHSRPIPGNGTGMKNCIPNYWEREREWGISFPTFGNGNGNEKTIPNFREREWEASIPGNGREREFPLTPAFRGHKRPFLSQGQPITSYFQGHDFQQIF